MYYENMLREIREGFSKNLQKAIIGNLKEYCFWRKYPRKIKKKLKKGLFWGFIKEVNKRGNIPPIQVEWKEPVYNSLKLTPEQEKELLEIRKDFLSEFGIGE